MVGRIKYQLRKGVSPAPNGLGNAFHPLAVKLLAHRGVDDEEAISRFLNPDFEQHLHDPFLFTDMHKAVERVLKALKENERIVVYSDYDCDGIPGGVILHDLLTAIGYVNFENYIPHRHEEGYGFNAASVTGFVERGASLLITVDCGITDHQAVALAQERGIDVIVTDHHEPIEILPPAYAIINPKRDDAYPFKGICGAGVAFKLAQAVLARGRADGTLTLPEGQEKWWLDLVGIATIADMVPLTDENRVLATYGLQVLRKSRRPGLQHLLRKSGGSLAHLTEDDIGFTIAPRINAASRMDDPEDAFHMLRTRDEGEAGARVQHLERLNRERKGIVAAMTREAKQRLHALNELPPIIVMGNPAWRPSLVGLVATSLTETYSCPAFIWGRDGQGIIKGSCRSGNGLSILELMEAASHTFITYGGHHASGGFSVANDHIHGLQGALIEAYERIARERSHTTTEMYLDAELSLEEVDDALMGVLASLAPFGVGNPKPIFRFPNIVPSRIVSFGKADNHTKLFFDTRGIAREAIAFFKRPDEFSVIPRVGKQLSLIAHLERSHFMGDIGTRLRIVDIV